MEMRRSGVIMGLVAVVLLVWALPGSGIWQVLLNEDFNKDQRVQELRWPWNTPPQNPNIGWHYNPRPPYYRAEPQYTDYSWGWQNYIYNVYVTRNADNQGAIWCAYTNQSNIQNPRWPEDDDYMPNQNAWAWWGPMDLRRAVDARIIFWYFLDVTYGSRDSLSVVVTDSFLTSNGNTFRTRCMFGFYRDPEGNPFLTTFNSRTQDWYRREFSLTNLKFLNANGQIRDSINVCKRTIRIDDRDSVIAGRRNLYLAFVWHSDAIAVTGKGAFIDDVMVVWDDGLFDIAPAGSFLGVRVSEDSINWLTEYQPRMNDTLFLKLHWRVAGNGQTPEFTIRCLLNGQEHYTENRQVVAGDSTYVTIADQPWFVTAGEHTIRWELDTPLQDSGRVDESNEQNNFLEDNFVVEWNPPPMFEIFFPANDSTPAYADSIYGIQFAIDDSNETDQVFTVYLYYTTDTSGLAGNPDRLFDYNYITHSFRVGRGEHTMNWNLPREFDQGRVAPGDLIYICGFATDGYPGNISISIAPGRFLILEPAKTPPSVAPPTQYGILAAYPNPFNKSLSLEFIIPTPTELRLAIYDLNGRWIETLAKGAFGAGPHRLSWTPKGLGAGIYMAVLETNGRRFVQKVVYSP